MSYQKVIIQGNLGNDPEMSYMPSGGAVAKLSVATSKKWKDKQSGEMREETSWHRVTFFNRTAEVAGEFLRKGSNVLIDGELKYGKYTDKNGVERYTTDIIGRELVMLGKSLANNSKPSSPQKPQHENDFDAFDDDVTFN